MLKIKWLGQAGYILSDGITTICIDPYLSDVVNRVANRPRTVKAPCLPGELSADVVICTHNHLDHLDQDAISEMNKDMLFLAPIDCKELLEKLGVTRYQSFNEGDFLQIGNFGLKAVYAEHTVPAIGVCIQYHDENLYFTGDTLLSKRLEEVQCDYLFVCINGKLGNMNVAEASYLASVIKPKVAVPNHYDMFESNSEDPEKFLFSNRVVMEHNREYEVKSGCLM